MEGCSHSPEIEKSAGSAALFPTMGQPLPAIPPAAARSAKHESERPKDQSDQKDDPEDLQRGRDQAAPAEQQEQEHEHDQCNQHPVPPWNLISEFLDSPPMKETSQAA